MYIKPDHLGDLLLATPVLAALRLRFPGARITALVGPWSQAVIERHPAVDVLLTCPFPGFTRSAKGSAWRPYLTLLRFALLLRGGRYDAAIIGRDDHWWGAALALLAGVPRRVGFAVPECRPFLTVALPWERREHVTAQGLALVEALEPGVRGQGSGVRGQTLASAQLKTQNSKLKTSPPSPGTRFDPAVDDVAWADTWLGAHGFGDDVRLVVIHPGSGGPAKLWFPERWAEVADAIAAAGARVLISGGPGEEALVDEVVSHMRTRPLTLAGQTTIGQLAALLRRATLVLGVDSGPLHLAAAQQVTTLHLYGPGDAGRFGPWGDPARHVVMRVDLWCSPCGVFSACPRSLARPECMERISAASVASQAIELLDAAC